MPTACDISKTRWHRYALDVVGGKVVACKQVIQTCQRYLDDLNDDRFELRIDRIAHAVRFIGILKHFKGLRTISHLSSKTGSCSS